MKRIFTSFTFWFMWISVIEICMYQFGQDSKGLILFGTNPIFIWLSSSNSFLYDIINSGYQISCNTIAGSISIYWYIASLLSFAFYGAILDCIRWGYKVFIGRNRSR